MDITAKLAELGTLLMPMTGATTLIRGSTAAVNQLIAAPPDRPVMPMRSESTSGRDSRESMARMAFHTSTPAGV